MKKTLLSLALTVLALPTFAADITEDWALASWGPSTNVTSESTATSTSTGIEYTFFNTKTSGKYLMMYGGTSNNAYITFKLPIDCKEFVLKTTSGCSTATTNTIGIYANDVAIVTKYAVNKTNTEYKVTIPEGSRTAGTVYKIIADGAKNPQFLTTTYVEATASSSLSMADAQLQFATPLKATQTALVKGAAENISGNITLSVDNAAYTLASTSVTAAELAAGVELTYNGATTGDQLGTLTATAGDLTATVDLIGLTVFNEGTEENPLTVADVLSLKSRNEGPWYVTGTIYDKTAANADSNGILTTAATAVATNIILADDVLMIGVALPTGETRTKLNIVDNPANVGKTVIVKGQLINYFSAPGVKETEYVSGLETTGIEAAVVDDNAPVEYFNLQGIRVDNPAAGLFIRRQGNKVSKVLVP